MGTDIAQVGETTPTGPSASGQTALRRPRPRTTSLGAMSQQGSGSHGNESYPQKLVQLVGNRDPELLLEAWGRLRLKRAAG